MDAAAALLASVYESFVAEEMRAWPVSTRVNTPKNNDAALLADCRQEAAANHA
jgi:putative SOS response-associated peptidase YedK